MTDYLITTKYYVGYGANLKRLRAVAPKYYVLKAAIGEKPAESVASALEQGTLNAGWLANFTRITKATRIPASAEIITLRSSQN